MLFTLKIRERQTPIAQLEWWDWRSSMIQYQPSKDYEYHSDDFSKPVGKIRSRKYPQGLLKKQNLLLLTTLTYIVEFQKATYACAFCFCLGVSRPFTSDTSPKWIDWEGLGKCRTGTRQTGLYIRNIIFTSNFVDILQGQTQRLIGGSFRGQNTIQGIKQSYSIGISFLTLNSPSLEPWHLKIRK